MSNPDRAIESIARRQFGAFDIAQARGAGHTNKMILVRTRSRAWLRVARGVYVIAAVPRSWEQRLMCAVLNHSGSAVCGHAAAAYHGLVGFSRRKPDLVVRSTGAHVSPLATLHRSDDVHVMQIGPLPIVTPVQALFDVAGTVPLRSLQRATEDALLRGIVDIELLEARFDELAPCINRGIGDMRQVLEVVGRRGAVHPETELEALLFELLESVDLTATRQHGLPWRSPVAMIVDALNHQLRLILEADGRRWHARVEALSTDRKRDRVALLHGYDTIRLTYDMLTTELDETRRDLQQYMARRRAELVALDSLGFARPA